MKKLQLLALSMLLSTSMVMMSKNTTTVMNADGTTTTTTCKGTTCTTRQNFKNRKKCRSNSCLRHQTPQMVVVEEVVPTTVVVEEIAPTKTTRTSTIRSSNLPETRSTKVTEYRTTRPRSLTDNIVTTTETRTVIQD